jgi:signal transduction histidine kinase
MKRRNNIRITEKLVLYFILIGIGAVAVAGFFSFYNMRNALLDRAFEQITDIRSVKKNQIEQFFKDREREISLLAASRDLSGLSEGIDKIDKPEATSYLARYIFASGYYSSLICSDYNTVKEWSLKKGADTITEVITPYDTHFNLRFLEQRFDSISEPLFVDYSEEFSIGDQFIHLAAPVYSAKGNAGFVALKIPLDVINSIITRISGEGGFGESGESYLVGEDFLMRSNSRFHDNSVMSTVVETDAVKAAFSEGEGLEIVQDYRNIKVLSSFAPVKINGLHWVLLTEIDFSEVLAPVNAARNRLLLISGIIGCLVFLVAWFFASKITKPILELKKATQEMAQGLYPVLETGESQDEINELKNTFNQMSSVLRLKQKQLEEEKTKRMTAVLDGQDKERKRLALDIHDGLIQSMVALKYQAELSLSGGPEKKQQIIEGIERIISEANEISNDLMPAVLHEFGLVTALKQLCERINIHAQKKISFETEGDFSRMNQRTATYLYRIAQEGLSNSVKHSGGDNIFLQLFELPNHFLMLVEDNGKGFDYMAFTGEFGNGIANMKERVSTLGGVIEFQSDHSAGTTIHIRIPKI